MKCALILLSLFALGYSVPLSYKGTYHIVLEDEHSISITGHSGSRLIFSRVLGHSGPRNVEIFWEDTYGTLTKLPLHHKISSVDSHYWNDLSEADILVKIFSHYQGDVDEHKYNDLLRQVHVYYQAGYLDSAIYHVLRCLSVHDVSFDRCIHWDSHSVDGTSPRHFWNLNHKWLNTFEHHQPMYHLNGEWRTSFGQEGHLGHLVPQHYYGHHLDASEGHLTEPAHYQSVINHQAPWNQYGHHVHSTPHHPYYQHHYLNVPVEY
ncbi:unnamed protein product [Phaedon cochleariae]|uniref:Uncharacterized protein n=1 Tax=Phaedon cochleariae TaxID=80249 RepID=A0A9P0GTC2_PHACE|nr:unnamed protein product [Phaedon cochleariae]